MPIKSVCKTEVITASKEASLKDISQLMQKHHVGCVVVTDINNGMRIPAGIITDRDVALCIDASLKPQELRVENIMRSKPFTVKSDEGIFETIVKMREHGVKRLPVVSEDGSLFGIVCADDLLNLMAEEISNLANITDKQVKKERGFRMQFERVVQG